MHQVGKCLVLVQIEPFDRVFMRLPARMNVRFGHNGEAKVYQYAIQANKGEKPVFIAKRS
jgi:hypothetical protein